MKKSLILAVLLLVFAALPQVAAANNANNVNWEEKVVTVTGIGVASPNDTIEGIAMARARSAAIGLAQRDLLEIIEGVQVDSVKTVKDNMLQSDIVQTKVSAVSKGAKIIDEGWDRQKGIYLVKMQVPIFGASSVAAAVLPPTPVKPFPRPAKAVTARPASVQTAAPSAPANVRGFTGIVIDCRGLGLLPVMSPVILDTNQRPIYGASFGDAQDDLAFQRKVNEGVVDYSEDIDSYARAGIYPIIIKATAVSGSCSGNPVISATEADYLLTENRRSHFLENNAVVFIMDGAV
jgi:hypothetical protein